MKTNLTRRVAVAAVLAASMAMGGTAWAGKRSEVELRQVGKTAIVYRGPRLDVALSYRFARVDLGSRWLLLDVAMTAPADIVEVPRTAIAVRTPSGDIVPLATQAAFGKDYPALSGTIMRANVAREPLNYFTPHRFARLEYFARPGYGLAFDTMWLDGWHNAYGRLFFKLPGGVQRGHYDLLINLPNDHVMIPFTL
ncbi:MAG: hypothetical protein ACM3O7_10505 [Acidobacteriota bacterium]